LVLPEPRLSLNKAVVTRYRIHLESRQLAPGTINGRLAAVRLVYEAADCGLLSPELAAGIRRVKGAKKLGVRLGNWREDHWAIVDLVGKGRHLRVVPEGCVEAKTAIACFSFRPVSTWKYASR
jgi:hypothetical protein